MLSWQASSSLLGLVGLLGEKDSLDVGQHTSLGNGHTRQKLVQLFIIADGQLAMSEDDPGLLVISCEPSKITAILVLTFATQTKQKKPCQNLS